MKLSTNNGNAESVRRYDDDAIRKKIIRRLYFYPAILVFCWIGAFVNRTQNYFDPDHPIILLYIWHYGFSALQGFLNALAFAFSPIVMKAFKTKFGHKEELEHLLRSSALQE